MIKSLTTFLFLGIVISLQAQRQIISIGTHIPLNYSVGYEYFNAKENFSGSIQTGILTKPYDKAILDIIKMFGTDEAIASTIGESFSHGFVFQPTMKYHFTKFYIGGTYSFYSLKAKDTLADAIEAYYSIPLNLRFVDRNNLILKSQIHNVGVLIGKEFKFKKNDSLSFITEFMFQKSFYSKSWLDMDSNYDFKLINQSINDELSAIYLAYNYLPSINIILAYQL